jgi:hypothetical protein
MDQENTPAATSEPYGSDTGRLRRDYPDFILLAGFENLGWRARMIPAAGMPGNGRGYVGRELHALDLDTLAGMMGEMRAGAKLKGAPPQ